MLLDDLNAEQREAVLATEGYVRVNAGAGTGKTRTLTYRCAFLLTALGISPRSVLCVTFTNKAAGELKQRLGRLCGEISNPFVTTFHGFCAEFLRQEAVAAGWPQNFSIRAGGNSLPQMTQTAVDSAVFGITGFLPPVKM